KPLSSAASGRSAEFAGTHGSDGQEAVEAAARWHDCLDLLITDVATPRTSCTLLVERQCSQRPSPKVILVSGHSRYVVANLGVQIRRLLAKALFAAELALFSTIGKYSEANRWRHSPFRIVE